MKLKALLILVCAALAPAAARAQDRDIPAMLSVARACLAQVAALRETETFHSRDMRDLVRKIASDIDYAETWSRHDHTVAATYLSAVMDCDGVVAAWVEDHGPRRAAPRRPERIAATDWAMSDWSQGYGPQVRDLSFLNNARHRRYAGQPSSPYSGQSPAPYSSQYAGQRANPFEELAAWRGPYSR